MKWSYILTMNYLFFDIECAKCGKNGSGTICEFGYVITDMQFNVTEQQVVTINPDMPFDLTGHGDKHDIELFYSEAKYLAFYSLSLCP